MGIAYNSNDPKVAMDQVNDMLKDLGDPYTRHIDSE